MRMIIGAGLLMVAAALGGCTSAVVLTAAPNPIPAFTQAPAASTSCVGNQSDIGVPEGAEQIQEAVYSADLPDAVSIGERPAFDTMPDDGTRIEAFVYVCMQEPMTRDGLIETATSIAVAIETQGAASPLHRLVVIARDHGELVEHSRVSTAFQLHDWSDGAAVDASRWE